MNKVDIQNLAVRLYDRACWRRSVREKRLKGRKIRPRMRSIPTERKWYMMAKVRASVLGMPKRPKARIQK